MFTVVCTMLKCQKLQQRLNAFILAFNADVLYRFFCFILDRAIISPFAYFIFVHSV